MSTVQLRGQMVQAMEKSPKDTYFLSTAPGASLLGMCLFPLEGNHPSLLQQRGTHLSHQMGNLRQLR